MKKGFLTVVVALLCAMVCAFGLVACTNNETPNENGNNGTQTVAVESVTLNKTELTLEVGGEETLTATVAPDNATDKTVTWSSDNAAVATVENGKVTAVSAGSATITATAGDKSATCTVTVNAPVTVDYTVTAEEWEAALSKDAFTNFTATVKLGDIVTYIKVDPENDIYYVKGYDGNGYTETYYTKEGDKYYAYDKSATDETFSRRQITQSNFESGLYSTEPLAVLNFSANYGDFQFDGDKYTTDKAELYKAKFGFENKKLVYAELDTGAEVPLIMEYTYGETTLTAPSEYTDGNEGGDPAAPDLTVGGKIFIFYDLTSDDLSSEMLATLKSQMENATIVFTNEGTFTITQTIDTTTIVQTGSYEQENSSVLMTIETMTSNGRPVEGADENLPITVQGTFDGEQFSFSTFVTNIFVIKTN